MTSSQLLGPNGQPISSSAFKKAAPPALGERYGNWSGENTDVMRLPGGGLLGFNLDELTLDDFRQMKDHYQINSSLSILTFMLHQIEYHVECEDKKLQALAEDQLENVWGRLVRSMGQSFWSGFSPNVLQWENDVDGHAIVLDKVKDLSPESCRVNWKRVDGKSGDIPGVAGSLFPQSGSAGKIQIYDGIKQQGWAEPIPVENSYWYPLLMENGNYYGKKLLRPAFQSWFFSILLHLFANRYYERFGEPTPIGRAPYDDDLDMNGKTVKGNKAMEIILDQLRNRNAVVLPNTKEAATSRETQPDYDYQIQYLESQMRGADFERYMTRLDEEMSLALFTPILLMRTADVGSYSLGEGHMQMYMLMLNAISSDWSQYINRYILAPIARFNSPRGKNHPRIRIKFRALGKENNDIVRDAIRQGLEAGTLAIDVKQLSEQSGMDVREINQLTKTDEELEAEQEPEPVEPPVSSNRVAEVLGRIVTEVAPQVANAYRRGESPAQRGITFKLQKAMTEAFRSSGITEPEQATLDLYSYMKVWVDDASNIGYETSEEFMRAFTLALNGATKETL